MKMRLTSARSIGVLLIAATALVVGACSGSDEAKDDKKSSDKTTTTEITPTTMNDEDYSAALTAFSDALEGAGSDLCAMGEAQKAVPTATPKDPAQMEETMGVYTDMLRTYAKALPDDPTTVATLNSSADALAEEAKAAGYPVDFLTPETPEDAPKALSTPEYLAANQALSTKFQAECAPEAAQAPEGGAAPETTVP